MVRRMPDRRAQQNLVRRPGALRWQAVTVRDLIADPPDSAKAGSARSNAGSSGRDLALGARDRVVPVSAPGVKLPG